jgi:hypothetical protein
MEEIIHFFQVTEEIRQNKKNFASDARPPYPDPRSPHSFVAETRDGTQMLKNTQMVHSYNYLPGLRVSNE